VLKTWETSFAAEERLSVIAARLLTFLAFLNFDDIFPALFERLSRGKKLAGGASEAFDRRWQSYVLPDGPTDIYTVEAAFVVL
jgi:hypothetical protein